MFDEVNDSIVVDASGYQMMIDEIAKLQAELAEAKKDAERYRYLQSLAKFGYNSHGFFMPSGNWDKESIEQMKVESNFYIDKAIDEFLKGEK